MRRPDDVHRLRATHSLLSAVLAFLLAAGLSTIVTGGARAEGALAIGNCGAVGVAFNTPSADAASRRALAECNGRKGRTCSVVASLKGNCAAFATDQRRACGPWGWAKRVTKEAAETAALDECRLGGGRSCTLRAAVCDEVPPPAMSTNWVATDLPQTECVARADALMREAGLTSNHEVIGQSVFGEQGNYTAQIRCVTEKSIVLFVVAGPDLEIARSHMRAIFDKF